MSLIASADVYLPTLYVGLPPPEDQIQVPLVVYQEVWETLSLRERRFYQRLNTLPFTEEEIHTFTAQLHEMRLVREDIHEIYDRLYRGGLSDERRQRLEDTLETHERRSREIEAFLAVSEPRIMAALRRIEEREPANWDHLPEDPVIPIVLNDVQRAALALVDETLAFVQNPPAIDAAAADADAAAGVGAADAAAGPGAGPGAGLGAGPGAGAGAGWT